MDNDDLRQARFRLLRQGDVLRVCPGLAGQTVGLTDASCDVAMLSQTCDIVQNTKHYCLVAPVDQVSEDDLCFVDAEKGRRPLRIPLQGEFGQHWVADVERAFPVRKIDIDPSVLLAHSAESDHCRNARMIRGRVARAFGRFPFPDEVVPVFKRLRDRVRSKAGGPGHLGQVLDLVDEIRVSADQWASPGRELKLSLIVASERLIPDDQADPSWTWERVIGWGDKDFKGSLKLDRTCELLLANVGQDATTVLNLWRKFGEGLRTELLVPYFNDEVVDVEVEVVSDEDFTLRQFNRSESLDLETLPDSFDNQDSDSSRKKQEIGRR